MLQRADACNLLLEDVQTCADGYLNGRNRRFSGCNLDSWDAARLERKNRKRIGFWQDKDATRVSGSSSDSL